MLAINQINIPAGAATAMARPKTNIVRSKTERTSTLPICGRRYGGNSSAKDDGTPFKTVLDNSLVAAKVVITPNTITAVIINADKTEEKAPVILPIKNIVISEIMVGNRPLQGTKLLVNTASNRSRGESIIRQPVTPAALHPKPIHIVSACFPQALQFLKGRSKLKAILGK